MLSTSFNLQGPAQMFGVGTQQAVFHAKLRSSLGNSGTKGQEISKWPVWLIWLFLWPGRIPKDFSTSLRSHGIFTAFVPGAWSIFSIMSFLKNVLLSFHTAFSSWDWLVLILQIYDILIYDELHWITIPSIWHHWNHGLQEEPSAHSRKIQTALFGREGASRSREEQQLFSGWWIVVYNLARI